MSARNHGYFKPCSYKHFYPVSVTHMKGLKFVALIIKNNTPVCEYTIHIKDETFDVFCDLTKFFVRYIFQLLPQYKYVSFQRRIISLLPDSNFIIMIIPSR